MQNDELTGDRLERSSRVAGVLLLFGALLARYLTELTIRRRPSGGVEIFYGYDLAARVLAPAGAVLIASSLAIRALTRPHRNPSARAQLVAGLALITVGLVQVAFGPKMLSAFNDFLGATGKAGILLLENLSHIVSLVALPLGIALLATLPIVRLAQSLHAHDLPSEPPEIESLS